MARAEQDAKMQHMTEEHKLNMSVLQLKQKIAIAKLASMESSHTPTEYSNAATILVPSETSTLTTAIHAGITYSSDQFAHGGSQQNYQYYDLDQNQD